MSQQAKLTLIRGLPGSGKSTLAQQLAKQTLAVHLEADMYFVDQQGRYQFDPTRLEQAHRWCLNKVCQYLKQGRAVIVSNTFVQHWEMKPYLRFAERHGLSVETLVCTGEYGSIHDVPAQTIEKMRQRWQN
ncbi:ATP-binding protein [Vibrio vulnificus]|uniref:ATP-binding protein n=1 Tax=Vibrio vulnificus TaxID=672 RepID=UPI0009B61253|nr:ATP-binding protein [Vibrio vulnificus]EGQ7833489.1 ATP-binding protein [Vibrio vulnificus]EGQ7852593.1 ATP-binding protein [Vibrio vulnificus]EGQ8072217.1 ATP-binding protein [Vibrio vulnificus]EGR0061396.1 ATP-binding protein [Vibrio vulnificus]EGR0393766.1 ATP-binding protein [Vibrio vulnificus]